MKRASLFLLALLGGLGLLPGSAKAGVITTFTDRPTFTTAVGGSPTVETFTSSDHFPISTGVLNSSTNLVVGIGSPILPGDIQPGVTYSTAIGNSFFFNIDSGGGFTGGFLDGFTQAFPNTLTTTFTGPVTAFGFDTNNLMGSNFSLTIHFLSGPDFTSSIPVSGSSFFGFQSSAKDIASAQILSNGSSGFSFALDNFTFTQPGAAAGGAVPEPTSLAVFGLATLAGAGYFGWRRRKPAAP